MVLGYASPTRELIQLMTSIMWVAICSSQVYLDYVSRIIRIFSSPGSGPLCDCLIAYSLCSRAKIAARQLGNY